MNVLFKKFKSNNNELFQAYDEAILRNVFDEVLLFLKSDECSRFTDDDLTAYVIKNLKKKSIVFLPNELIMKPVLVFFLNEFSYYKDSYDVYYDEVKKLIWSILSKYITDVSMYLDDLTVAILYELAIRELSISTLDIFKSIIEYPSFESLSHDAVSDVIESVYHYFVDKDLIQMVD